VVFYDGEICLGGGVIERTWRDGEPLPARLTVELTDEVPS